MIPCASVAVHPTKARVSQVSCVGAVCVDAVTKVACEDPTTADVTGDRESIEVSHMKSDDQVTMLRDDLQKTKQVQESIGSGRSVEVSRNFADAREDSTDNVECRRPDEPKRDASCNAQQVIKTRKDAGKTDATQSPKRSSNDKCATPQAQAAGGTSNAPCARNSLFFMDPIVKLQPPRAPKKKSTKSSHEAKPSVLTPASNGSANGTDQSSQAVSSAKLPEKGRVVALAAEVSRVSSSCMREESPKGPVDDLNTSTITTATGSARPGASQSTVVAAEFEGGSAQSQQASCVSSSSSSSFISSAAVTSVWAKVRDENASDATGDDWQPLSVTRTVRGRGTARFGAKEEQILRAVADEKRHSWVDEDVNIDCQRLQMRPGKKCRSHSRSCKRSRSRRHSRNRSSARVDETKRAREKARSSSRGKDRKNVRRSRSRSRRESRRLSRSRRSSRRKSRSRSRKGRSCRSRSRKSQSRKRSCSRTRRKKDRSRTTSRCKRGKGCSSSSSTGRRRRRASVVTTGGEHAAPGAPTTVQAGTEVLPPYTHVRLCNLVKNQDLNGLPGVILPQACSANDEVPGCLKVRLESGREVAVKPSNLQVAAAGADVRQASGALPPHPVFSPPASLPHVLPALAPILPNGAMYEGFPGGLLLPTPVPAATRLTHTQMPTTVPSQELVLQTVLAKMKSEGLRHV
eukprot:TRINITY_DN18993_c3_g1_i1.p1 TRINITY_DN18993_c3_g1~~TRINITY_DN18993_c3_g1_i1.p1  ORF type:complete len:688 (-),score=83.88 TRINITY_DN18993_c3_g1_i1:163-2226(-)